MNGLLIEPHIRVIPFDLIPNSSKIIKIHSKQEISNYYELENIIKESPKFYFTIYIKHTFGKTKVSKEIKI